MLNRHLSDEDLWLAIINDDSEAFAVLLKRYWKPLYTTAYGYLKDTEAAESVVQDIFIYLWEKRKKLAIENFEKYLNSSARYSVYKRLKVLRASPVSYKAPLEIIDSVYTYNGGEENISVFDLLHHLNACLEPLPYRCKEIFVLSRVDQLSNNEIATRLQISKRTVENQITHALKHLRTYFKYSGILLVMFSFFDKFF